jgi:uncharacterized integral membrane protein (TIGR00698 family)
VPSARTAESSATAPSPRTGIRRGTLALLPGLTLVTGVAAVATWLGRFAPVVGAPVIAIMFGIVITLVRRPPAATSAGISFASRTILQASIVMLGFGLSLRQVVSSGAGSLPVLVGTLGAALGMAWLAGRLLRLPTDLRTLIGVGTAICGASAIAATNSVIDADEADVSYAIATIFTFNVIAVLLYPSLGHAFGFSQRSFGVWSGTAINDLSSVVAASTIYGHAAASYGVVVKLTRTLAIIPICVFIAARRGRCEQATAPGRQATPAKRIDLGRIVPAFILAFVAAVIANTVGLVPAGTHHTLSIVATWMITAALAAIGLSTDIGRIRLAGLRPLALGGILWLTVGLASLGLQALTGNV